MKKKAKTKGKQLRARDEAPAAAAAPTPAKASIRLQAHDIVEVKKRTVTEDGYLIAPANLSKADNIQRYTAGELGLTDRPPNTVLRMLRERSAVFDDDAMRSFEHAPVTLNHPPKNVSAHDWRDFAVGHAYGMKQKGDHMSGTLRVNDHGAVKAIQAGKAEISLGYDFDFDDTPGALPTGEEYDGKQTNIRGNHVAIVDTARGGPTLRIADSAGGANMEFKSLKFRGVRLRVADAEADAAESAFDAAVSELTEAKKEAKDNGAELAKLKATATDSATKVETLTAANAELTTKLTAADAALAESKKLQVTDAQIEALAEERQDVVAFACKAIDGFEHKGKGVGAIRLAVLQHLTAGDSADEGLKGIATAVLGGVALDKADAKQVRTAYDAVKAATGRAGAQDAGQDADVMKALVGHDDGGHASAQDDGTKLRGRDAFMSNMQQGFKKAS